MIITELKHFLPGVEHSLKVKLVDKAGCLSAWSCEGWLQGDTKRKATFLVVYRSVLATDTCRMYKPVMDLIMAADHSEVVRSNRYEDPTMLRGIGESILMLLYKKGVNPPYSKEEINKILEELL